MVNTRELAFGDLLPTNISAGTWRDHRIAGFTYLTPAIAKTARSTGTGTIFRSRSSLPPSGS